MALAAEHTQAAYPDITMTTMQKVFVSAKDLLITQRESI